jgi:hypothetical protein
MARRPYHKIISEEAITLVSPRNWIAEAVNPQEGRASTHRISGQRTKSGTRWNQPTGLSRNV